MPKKNYPKNWIKELRVARGLTAKELGALVGTSGQNITMIERRERGLGIPMARRIAAVLECHFVEVIDGPGALLASLPDDKKKLLEKYDAMQDKDRENYLSMGDIFAGGGPATETAEKPEKNQQS